jgi:hypothetical protein
MGVVRRASAFTATPETVRIAVPSRTERASDRKSLSSHLKTGRRAWGHGFVQKSGCAIGALDHTAPHRGDESWSAINSRILGSTSRCRICSEHPSWGNIGHGPPDGKNYTRPSSSTIVSGYIKHLVIERRRPSTLDVLNDETTRIRQS